MNRLAINRNETIEISPEFFDPNGFTDLLARDYSGLTLAKAGEVSSRFKQMKPEDHLGLPISKDDGYADVFGKVLDLMENDNELGETIKKSREGDEEEQKAIFEKNIKAEIDPKVYNDNLKSFRVTKEVKGIEVTYLINDKPAIRFYKDQLSSSSALSAEMLLAWIQLIWDSTSFLGTVIGIALPDGGENGGSFAKFVQRTIDRWNLFVDAMRNMIGEGRLRQIEHFVNAWQKINLAELGAELFKAIFSNLPWYKKAWTVVKFLAAVILLFLSAAATLLAKLAKAALQLVGIVGDVESIVELSKGEPVSAG
jgi:hypothetical protein